MPQKTKFKLPSLNLGRETFGQRLSRLRKERGYTQVELAQKIGIVQTLISSYEIDRRRPQLEMVARLALALDISTDELVGLKKAKKQSNGQKPKPKFMKRLLKIEELPPSQQKTLMKTIDTFIQAAQK